MHRAPIPLIMALICAAFAPGLAPAQEAPRAPAWSQPPAAEGFSYPDCYCTNRGARVEMGALSCLTVGSRSFTARCDMSLNNPTWREVKDGCDPGPSVRLWQGDGAKPG
jgi:hypothetical protein